MKGWIVSADYAEGSAIVFAETRDKAKLEVLYDDAFCDCRYTDLRVHRCPEIDGMENHQPTDNPWLNDEIRLILVKKYDWCCTEPGVYEDCDECCAKDFCHMME